MNGSFRSSEQTALFRFGNGMNVPLPVSTDRAKDSILGLRQEIALTSRHVDLGGSATLDVTELTAKRIALTYREGDACSVDYSFDLVEAACPRDCESSGAILDVGPDRSMRWSCACK